MDKSQRSHNIRKGNFGHDASLLLARVLLLVGLASLHGQAEAGPKPDHFADLSDEYLKQTLPLIQGFCLDCVG